MAPQLVVPDSQLEAERDRLGVNAVGAADHHRVAMLHRLTSDRLDQRVDVLQQQVDPLTTCIARAVSITSELVRPKMNEAGVLADRLAHGPAGKR